MPKFREGDEIVISDQSDWESGSRGVVTSREPIDDRFDYVVQLKKFKKGELYEFREYEIEKTSGCRKQHTPVWSTEKQQWVCPFCEL